MRYCKKDRVVDKRASYRTYFVFGCVSLNEWRDQNTKTFGQETKIHRAMQGWERRSQNPRPGRGPRHKAASTGAEECFSGVDKPHSHRSGVRGTYQGIRVAYLQARAWFMDGWTRWSETRPRNPLQVLRGSLLERTESKDARKSGLAFLCVVTREIRSTPFWRKGELQSVRFKCLRSPA